MGFILVFFQFWSSKIKNRNYLFIAEWVSKNPCNEMYKIYLPKTPNEAVLSVFGCKT